jgi:DNA-binding GntR family transcriptional regulator
VDSLSTKVADALREAIVSGELRHGDPITHEAVAKRFSVSTMPVREALQLLAHEGMIEARPNRRFQVARMARKDVEDIYWSHGVLEGRLTARACEHLSDASLLELEENCQMLRATFEEGDMVKVERLNWDFHRKINRAADSPKIVALLKTTVNQVPMRFYTLLGTWGQLSIDDHDELLRALRQRDASKAEKIAVEHVAAAGRMLVDYLDSQGYWEGVSEPSTSSRRQGPDLKVGKR